MRTECLNYKLVHGDLLPVTRLIANIGNKMQICTQRYDRRPYGVGLLVAGYDVSTFYSQPTTEEAPPTSQRLISWEKYPAS